jgi:hypothetical protein
MSYRLQIAKPGDFLIEEVKTLKKIFGIWN